MRIPVCVLKRLSLSEANQELHVLTVPLFVRCVRARVVWIQLQDPTNPPLGPLTSILRINDFLEIPITPEDVSEGIPQMRWESVPIPFHASGIKVRWDVPWGPEVTDALLEIQVAGYVQADPKP